VFGLTIGSLEILGFLGLERKHVPNSFATRIRENLKKATNPYTAFIAGILVSLFLLPCTSGSYFVALDLLAKNATAAEGLLLLTLYNAIVVLPFIAIGVAIYTLTYRTAKLRIWLTSNEKWLRLFGGVTMIFISLLLII
jgi:cytochrome c biogenesis protein CcdA